MNDDARLSAAGRSYTAAHAAHYGSKDLRRALRLYEELVAAHPDTEEAGYSRSQIQNIARSVVPAQDLLAAQVALALTSIESVDPAQATGSPAS